MNWQGRGEDPYRSFCREAAKKVNLATAEELVPFLRSNFDKNRIDKAIKMLKKEKFQLYSEVTDDIVCGIVSSQTDPDLVYACKLNNEGEFACNTQNLKVCGGLKGSLCKHILVLLVGLTAAKQLAPTRAAQLVLASKPEKPKTSFGLGKVFLKYKGAQACEIDWRPTETIPEDYYAF
jgi:hypothetical protein